MKKFLLLLPWTKFRDVHLTKDVGLFPEYLGKEYNLSVDFVFLDNTNAPKYTQWHGMNLKKLHSQGITEVPRLKKHPFKFFQFLKIFTPFLKENKETYSYIMMFHVSPITLYFIHFIKKLNKEIKIYIKADAANFSKRGLFCLGKILKKCDALSIESESLVKKVKDRFPKFRNKVSYVPNGFDDNNFDTTLLSIPKENLIISTARFGTRPKNTQLLLDILSKVDLKDWTVILAGTVEESFKSYIQNFFEKYPALKDKIKFVGNISDRNSIYELYARSKIFILTSRWESFCISLMEAAFFGGYIISTDVGIAQTIQRNFAGFVAEGNPNDTKNNEIIEAQIVKELQKCIDNPSHCILSAEMQKKIQNTFSMTNIVQQTFYKNFFDDK